MYPEAKKLHLIKEVLKISNEKTLIALENFIKKAKKEKGNAFKDFSGIWSAEEANEIERAINEGCEQINPNDWK